jgi:hypothetical protein
MRIPAGPVAFFAAAAVTVLLIAGASFGLALLVATPGTAEPLRSLPDNPWWFMYREAPKAGSLGSLWRIGAAIASACVALVAAFRSRALFRKSASPVLPFLILFLFSLGMECLRAGTGVLYALDRSISAGVLLTRLVYWARFVGLLALLLAGLFCIEMRYRRYIVLSGVVFLVSFAMAAYIPVDRTVFLAQLTWKLGDEQGVWFVNLVIGFLAVAASAGAALSKRDTRYLVLAGGFTLLLLSRELLFFSVAPMLLAGGLASLAAGIVVCLRVLLAIYRQMGKAAGG